MNELDDVWGQMIEQAQAQAQAAGRTDIAEYLSLKAGNDALRIAGCQWLVDSLLELSEQANRQGIRLDIETEKPHRFAVGHSTMVGALVRFRYGVRCLSVETGWTRTPADGFMRGGALAHARISHFGMSKQNVELLLLKNDETPFWAIDKVKSVFGFSHLGEHFELFLG